MTETTDGATTATEDPNDSRLTIGAFIMPFNVAEGDVDMATGVFLKTARDLGLTPPEGPRAPLDPIATPFVILPTAHWNQIQTFIDASGVREGYNALGGILQAVPRDVLGYDDWSVPQKVAATRRWIEAMRGVTAEEHEAVFAEAMLGPGATIEDYRAFVAKVAAREAAEAEKKEPSDG